MENAGTKPLIKQRRKKLCGDVLVLEGRDHSSERLEG